MMQRRSISWLVVVLLGFLLNGHADEAPAPLRISIVPTHSCQGKKVLEPVPPKKTIGLDVVLTNVSTAPVSIWEEWCSWGFFCLSFDLETDGQHRRIVHEGSFSWFYNLPTPFVIDPGEHHVLHASFTTDSWPMDWIKPGEIKLQAIYTIEPLDKIALKAAPDVWVGTVVSEPSSFTIR